MLILSLKEGEEIILDLRALGKGLVKITVAEIMGENVRLGVEAARDVPIHRAEIQQRIDRKEPR